MRTSIIGARPPVHRFSPFPQIVIVLCPLFLQISSGTAIAILRACRAHRLARWHRFVSIERREPLQTSLQGTSVRAMIFFMSGAPQRQQLASERTPLTSFAPAPSTVSCVPLTRNLSPEECSRRSEEKYYSIDSRYQTPTVLDFEKVFVYL